MASAAFTAVAPPSSPYVTASPPRSTPLGWLSPRTSFSMDAPLEIGEQMPSDVQDVFDFEFRLDDDPVAMLPADELFSGGKLVPLQVTSGRHVAEEIIRSPELRRRVVELAGSELFDPSPRAPRCSSRWRELLGLKKIQRARDEILKPDLAVSRNASRRYLTHVLHRKPVDASLNLPLLRDSDSESASASSRPSLSSSSSTSSGADHEELPRLSLDADKTSHRQIALVRAPPAGSKGRPKSAARATRVGRSAARESAPPPRGASVDSPRMTSSGKVVFHGLEKSSSGPSACGGASRGGYRLGIDRSYSGNVLVAPVLNVPVPSLRGSGRASSDSAFLIGHLFTPQKKDREGPGVTVARTRSGVAGEKAKIERERVSGDRRHRH